jgi:hypothetical protein
VGTTEEDPHRPASCATTPAAWRCDAGYRARFIDRIGIAPLIGGRSPVYQRQLQSALDHGGYEAVCSLRRDSHESDASCWFHGGDFCLSARGV